jgi:hypothetical protein
MIKFVCSCGKHLRARDEMAARRSVCPRCGNPVGIPSLQPNHPGALPPMTPAERLRHARTRAPLPADEPAPPPEPAAPAPRKLDTRVVRLLSTRKQPRPDLTGRYLEDRWYQCLDYPLRAWRLCVGLALFMTMLSAAVAVLLPHALAEEPTDPEVVWFYRPACLLLLAAVAGLPFAFLDCVMTSAVSGEIYYIRFTGNPLLAVLLGEAKWAVCFLAGPVVFAAAGVWYWLHCGDPGPVDWLILTELGVVAFAYEVFALLAVSDRGRLRDLNPVAVIDMAHRLGWRSLLAVLAAALVFLAHGWVLLAGLAEVHKGTLPGWMMLCAAWVSGVLASTFFFRLLGVWCHRSRVAAVASPVEEDAA